jgi:hypothetical protein
MAYLKDKINELESNSKNKSIRDLYRGKNEFKKGCQPRTTQNKKAFITVAFQLCFAICHQKGPRKPGWTETEWDTSIFDLCW